MLATTFSIVAVFLPIGFMGGIIGKFFHEFGVTIVAAVLISMFVSFTLDPMLSSIWHDPADRRRTASPSANPTLLRQDHRPRDRLVRPRHRARWPRPTRASCAGRWRTSWPRVLAGRRRLRHQHRHGAAAGHRVRAQGGLLGDHDQFLHAGRLVARSDRSQGAAGRGDRARVPRGAVHAGHHQHRRRAGQDLRVASTCGWSTARQRTRSVDADVGRAARAAASRCRASPSRTSACSTRSAATSRSSSRCRAPT